MLLIDNPEDFFVFNLVGEISLPRGVPVGGNPVDI
jgi:hypothetical protein